jgi:hypothetical protein
VENCPKVTTEREAELGAGMSIDTCLSDGADGPADFAHTHEGDDA